MKRETAQSLIGEPSLRRMELNCRRERVGKSYMQSQVRACQENILWTGKWFGGFSWRQ